MATEAVFLRLEHFKSSLHMRSVTQSIHPISLYRRLQTTTRHLLPLTLLLLLGLLTTTTAAASTPDARSVIHQTLQIMQHDGGAKFNYSFHLGKLFNRHGTMIYKGNKSLSWNKKSMVWANGETAWFLDRRKRVVKVMNPGTDRRGLKGIDGQLASLTRDYSMTLTIEGDSYKIHLRACNKSADASQAYLYINRKTYYPTQIKVKIKFLWGKILLSNFETGNYSDAMFTFPHKRFPNVKIVDKRK